MQNPSVADGGNAIVGNVTQHASVIVKGTAAVARKPPRASEAERENDAADTEQKAQA